MYKCDPSKLVFFLGGLDAEMIEIQNIIKAQRLQFKTKDLAWGAKVSDYSNEFNKLESDAIPVLIELKEDVPLPANAITIDHHNEKSGGDKPTSIEQIASLLKIKLNRWQQLISANDRDLFKGLQLIDVTSEEISKINDLENKIQNITDKDYHLAKQSIDHFSEIIENDTIIINSLTSKTRPLLQLLYNFEYKSFKFQNIFIFDKNNSMNYTGTGELINNMVKKYKALTENDNAIDFWWGGHLPCRGYFGSTKLLQREEIVELVRRPIISQHIFLFPFIIDQDYTEVTHNKKFNDSIDGNRKDIYEKVIEELRNNNNGWNEKKFSFSSRIVDQNVINNFPIYDEQDILNYNEYYYFYDFIRRTLYGKDLPNSDKNLTSYLFEKEYKQGSEFIISIKDDCRVYNYHLNIENISLRIVENGIGVLSFTLYNYLYAEPDSILKINDFGRRIYPQYLGREGTEDTKKVFLPDKITLLYEDEITEDFGTDTYLKQKNNYADYISKLLLPIKKFSSIIDDRMYTISWYGNNELLDELKQYNEQKEFNYENNRFWYMYTFVDGKSAGIGNNNMRKELIKTTAYPRFIEDGTLFGISRYSFVCLTDRNNIPYNIVRNHLKGMYYQIAILVLVQRASIIKFNEKIAEISAQIHEKESLEITKKIEELSADIIEFSNSIWFDEVTSQEQGIELYKLAQTNMGIPEQLTSLQKRANELFTYHELVNQRKSAQEVEVLTRIGIVFLPLTLIAAVGAVEVYFIKTGANAFWSNLSALGIFISSTVFITLITRNIVQHLKSKPRKENDNSSYNDNPLWLIFRAAKKVSTIVWLILWLISLVVYFIYK